MYTNEIAKKLDMRVSLVIHHLNNLKYIGIVKITNKKITPKKKFIDHKFYSVDPEDVINFINTEMKKSLNIP